MKRALIIGDSGGIGGAVRAALESRNVEVTGLSRSRDGLNFLDEDNLVQALSGMDPEFDLVFVATGQLNGAGLSPEKTLKSLTPQAMADQFEVNCIGPAMILKHVVRLLPRDRQAVFAALSARVGSIGDNQLGGWYSYRTAKAALNQIIHTGAIELARTHKQAICVALHPGTVATQFTKDYAARHKTVTAPEAAHNLLSVIDRLDASHSGQFFDWKAERVPW
jgi:NAD(P)-dependent dehydrogenase (short-subunit alcohol dehydrogenase family)